MTSSYCFTFTNIFCQINFQHLSKRFPRIFCDALNKMMYPCQPTYAAKYLMRYLAAYIWWDIWLGRFSGRSALTAWRPTCESKQAENMWQLDQPHARMRRAQIWRPTRRGWDGCLFQAREQPSCRQQQLLMLHRCLENEWETPPKKCDKLASLESMLGRN